MKTTSRRQFLASALAGGVTAAGLLLTLSLLQNINLFNVLLHNVT